MVLIYDMKKINRVIILLILSDILILAGFGLITPIFAIFVKEGISGGSVFAAGLAVTVFLVIKSVAQIPLSIYLDTKKGKLSFLYIGTILVCAVPFIYAFSKNVNWIYVAQAVYGLGAATAYPAWLTLFTMHVDRKHRGFEWSLWSTSIGLGTALTAFVGARLVTNIGFKNLFFITGGMALAGFIILLCLSKKYLRTVDNVTHELVNMSHLSNIRPFFLSKRHR